MAYLFEAAKVSGFTLQYKCICLFVLRIHKKNTYIFHASHVDAPVHEWKSEPYWCMKPNLKHLGTNINANEEFPSRIQLLLRQRWSDYTELPPFSVVTHRAFITPHWLRRPQRKRHFSMSSLWPSRRLNSKVHEAQSMSMGCILAPFFL